MRPSFLGAGLLAALVATAPPVPALGQPDVDTPQRVTPDQQREISRLLARFRAARGEPAERAAVVDAAIQAGQPAVRQLYMVIAKQIYPALEQYRGRFYQQASQLARSRLANIRYEEVARLRHAVLSLQQEGALTKQAIVTRADPALQRLEEIFVVDRADVLAGSEQLRAERQEMFELGTLWERCAEYLYRLMPDDDNKPKEPLDFETYLQGEEQLAAGLAAPMAPGTKSVLVANRRLGARLEPEEARAILAANLMRNLLGDFSRVGVGRSGAYFTQVFGK